MKYIASKKRLLAIRFQPIIIRKTQYSRPLLDGKKTDTYLQSRL
ncbi:MAG: hypothetical protein ACI9J2_000514 [Saprospiraceae bacterium]|jgi:hypothetical protein